MGKKNKHKYKKEEIDDNNSQMSKELLSDGLCVKEQNVGISASNAQPEVVKDDLLDSIRITSLLASINKGAAVSPLYPKGLQEGFRIKVSPSSFNSDNLFTTLSSCQMNGCVDSGFGVSPFISLNENGIIAKSSLYSSQINEGLQESFRIMASLPSFKSGSIAGTFSLCSSNQMDDCVVSSLAISQSVSIGRYGIAAKSPLYSSLTNKGMQDNFRVMIPSNKDGVIVGSYYPNDKRKIVGYSPCSVKNVYVGIREQIESNSSDTEIKKVDISSSENILNENRKKEMEKNTDYFVNLLCNTDFENGMDNEVFFYFDDLMRMNKSVTREWLNDIFITNYGKADVLMKILYLLSDYSLLDLGNNATAMATMGVNHKNDKVKYAALKAFGHWRSYETLIMFENIEIETSWVKMKLDKLIKRIKEEYDSKNN